MKSLSLLSAAALAVIFFTVPATAAAPVPMTPAGEKANLDKIPPTDPAVTNPPQLVDAMKGVHPRLLFTTAEMAALKQQIPTDPLLQKAYDGTSQWAKIALVPSGPKPPIVTDDTSALVKSFSQAPAMAYAYSLDHDPEMKKKIVDTLTEMLNQPYWADVTELDSSMGGACNMFMVALLYDSVYSDLDPAMRSQLSAKILLQARRMYYLGHKELSIMPYRYWTLDPQPNHRWYRDMGLVACVLAVADEKDLDTGYLLQSIKDEMDFVMKWYPPDGDCHEGTGYQAFGYTPIVTACEMMDRNLGTTYLKDSGLKNAWTQQIYYWVPGRLSDISWGDDQNSAGSTFGSNDATFFVGPRLSRDKMAQAALLMKMQRTFVPDKKGNPPILPWTMLAFYDPTVGQGDISSLPTYKLLPDIGSASMRDSWDDNAVVFTFKCGPYGGYKLNDYRMANLVDGKPHPVNEAHDHPDATDFALAVGNGFAFYPGVYSTKQMTDEHSTITVDDKGQVAEGGVQWTPAVSQADMSQFSYLTGWKTDDKGHIIIEGEAGNAYRGTTASEVKSAQTLPDPVLKTYRRTAIWMPKDYILILDNIVPTSGTHKITWHGTTPVSQIADGKGTATTETGTAVPFQIVSDKPLQYATVPISLVGRWGTVPIQQVQATANADAVKFATVLDPWNTHPEVKLAESGGVTTVTVHSSNYDDTWTWKDAKDNTTPSQIDGARAGAPLISLTETDKAPRS